MNTESTSKYYSNIEKLPIICINKDKRVANAEYKITYYYRLQKVRYLKKILEP